MNIKIKPDEWIEISKGDCTVWGGNSSSLIRFRSNDKEIASSYLINKLKLKSEYPIEATSSRFPITISIDKPKEKEIKEPVKKTKAKASVTKGKTKE